MNFVTRVLILLIVFTTNSQGADKETTEKKVASSVETASQDKPSEKDSSDTKTSTEKPAEKATSDTTTSAETSSDKKNTDKKVADAKDSDKKKAKQKPLPEIGLGSKDAPVVMINYSSLTCGHCAHFTKDVLPLIEKKYIKPGHLRIVFRDYPGDQLSLKAHQLAWCKGEIKYLDFMKILYDSQEKWLLADDPVAALKGIALKNGITAKQFDACLKNQDILDQIITMRLEGQKKYKITATPTIIINAKIYQKALTLEELDTIMKPLLAAAGEKPKKG